MSWNYAGRWGADHITNSKGNPLLNTVVRVFVSGTTTPATLYTDRTKSTTVSSVSTDANGNLSFYVDPGLYDLSVNSTVTITVEVEPDSAEISSDIDTLRTVNGLFYNPVDYGADPTGVIDSTAAIQTCLFLGHCELPAGQYKVTNLYMPTASSLIGRHDYHGSIYSTNPMPKNITRLFQPTGTTGPLITIPMTVNMVAIKNVHLDGYYTASTDNIAVYAEDNPTSITGTTLASPASVGNTSIVVSSISEVRKAASLALQPDTGSNYELVTVSTSWDEVSTTIPLVSPVTASHASGNIATAPASALGEMNLRMENASVFNFAGDQSIYIGRHRYGNKFEHIIVFGAGRIITWASGTAPSRVPGTARNNNAVGFFSYGSDSGIHASEFGASASHNVVIACQPFSITECDIWSGGVCARWDSGATAGSGTDTITDSSVLATDTGRPVGGVGIPTKTYIGAVTTGTSFKLVNSAGSAVNTTASVTGVTVGGGNNIRVMAGGSTSRIYIGSRTEFDQSAFEAIHVEGQSSDPKGDVQIGPGATFSDNCKLGVSTGGSDTTRPTCNIRLSSDFIGSATVTGNTAFGPANSDGSVDYDLSFGNTSTRVLYDGNRMVDMLGNGINSSAIWFGSYSPTGTNRDTTIRFSNFAVGSSEYLRKNTNDGYALAKWNVAAAGATILSTNVSSDTSDPRMSLKTDGLYLASGSATSDASIVRPTAGGIRATPSLQINTGAVITSGTGAPTATGTKGDIYFRTDTPTTANQRIYINSSATTGTTWTGIV